MKLQKPKIVITDAATVSQGELDLSPIESQGDLTIYDSTPDSALADRIADADILLCNKTKIDRTLIAGAKRLSLIALFATGYNNIDTIAAREHGIVVSNAGQYSTAAVAQHTFALILELCSKVGNYNNLVRSGMWRSSALFSPIEYKTSEIYGKTLGIFGFGSIGRAVAEVGRAFGMRVIACTRTPRETPGVEFVCFDRLLAESDVLSVHCPLTAETTLRFGAREFAAMKKSAIFINTSRGGTVDEIALANALDGGEIAAAGLDVLTIEPQSGDCPLTPSDRLIITPHVAWTPIETRKRLVDIVADNVRNFLDGHPTNVVN